MKSWFRYASLLMLAALGAGVWCARAAADPLPFRRAIELAVAHSSVMTGALADETRAYQSYRETRNAFLPQLVLGSGLGYSNGFPLSIEGAAPSVFNVNTQQFLLNFAQREFVRAAKTEYNASNLSAKDKRAQVMLDAAITYVRLDNAMAQLKLLQDQHSQAQRVVFITGQRVSAGVDAKVELTKANLTEARVRMRMAQIRGDADLMRQHLADLTGLPAAGIETVTESIPALPEVKQQEDLVSKALNSSVNLKAAMESARAKEFAAKGEHRALYPAIDLAGQYAVLSKINNYQQFFARFQRNNVTVGLNMRLPLLNTAQKARAQAADAEAAKAKSDAQAVKSQVSAEALKLQRSVEQLAAARDVAQLEYELAQSDLETVGARLQVGTASLRDQENARLAVNDKYSAFLDASLELDKARLQLLKATGELESWIGH
jgi:outer membrane protein TolC